MFFRILGYQTMLFGHTNRFLVPRGRSDNLEMFFRVFSTEELTFLCSKSGRDLVSATVGGCGAEGDFFKIVETKSKILSGRNFDSGPGNIISK